MSNSHSHTLFDKELRAAKQSLTKSSLYQMTQRYFCSSYDGGVRVKVFEVHEHEEDVLFPGHWRNLLLNLGSLEQSRLFFLN